MNLTLKCPYCGSRGKVPERFLGTRLRCLVCQGRFQSDACLIHPENTEVYSYENLGETDRIVLFGCHTCDFLGSIPASYKSSTVRCPACDHLSSLEAVEGSRHDADDLVGASPTRRPAGGTPPPPPPPPLPAAEWHYARDGRRLGPIALVALKTLAATGRLAPTDLVWKAGMPEWQTAAMAGLFPREAPPLPDPLPALSPSASLSLGRN